MAAHFKRKHLRNLDELNKEQEKILRTCKRMEKDWLSGIFNPQQIALNAATGWLFGSPKGNKGKSGGKTGILQSFTGGGNTSSSYAVHIARNLIAGSGLRRLLKGMAMSWLRWQAFNLALYLGRKAYRSIRHRKAEKKLRQELTALNRLERKKR